MVEETKDLRVAPVVGIKTGPQVALEGSHCASSILVDGPRVLGHVFADRIEAVRVESGLVTLVQTLHFFVLGRAHEKPVLELKAVSGAQAGEALVSL